MFIIRIWLEPREIADATPEWRGVIEHVPSRKRHYLKDLNDIPLFIAPYLDSWSTHGTWYRRMKRWLRWWRRY